MKVIVTVLQKKTPLWVTILTIILAALAVWNGIKANQLARKTYTAEHIPRLIVSPLTVRFYPPDVPETAGQVKIEISPIIENVSEAAAREVTLNFETKDWYGHKTSLFKIYEEAKHPVPHILSLPKNSRMVYPSYTPDAPASGLAGFLNQEKPFDLKLTLSWKDVDGKEYVYVGFYILKNAPLPAGEQRLYFQPLSTYDSVKDGELAWKNAKHEL